MFKILHARNHILCHKKFIPDLYRICNYAYISPLCMVILGEECLFVCIVPDLQFMGEARKSTCPFLNKC